MLIINKYIAGGQNVISRTVSVVSARLSNTSTPARLKIINTASSEASRLFIHILRTPSVGFGRMSISL